MFENASQPIDLYCERLSAAFWAEPVNALTNLAFIFAGVFAYSLWRKTSPQMPGINALTILAMIVGIGSFIFHTVATKGAMLFDIIPIIVFIFYATYLIFRRVFHLPSGLQSLKTFALLIILAGSSWLTINFTALKQLSSDIALTCLVTFFIICMIALTRIFKLSWINAPIALVGFFIFTVLFLNYFGRTALNGSIQYMPTFILLLGVSVVCYFKKYPPAKEFLIAALIFLVSLICRSVDARICDAFPMGTHFLWHILNAVTMYYVMRGIIKSQSVIPAKAGI